MSGSLWPYRLQHTRLPCPSLSPGVCSNSCPLSRWCHPTVLSSITLLLLFSIFPSFRVFFNELALRIKWPKYWSSSISPFNECSGLISFRVDWFEQVTEKLESQTGDVEANRKLLSCLRLESQGLWAVHQMQNHDRVFLLPELSLLQALIWLSER